MLPKSRVEPPAISFPCLFDLTVNLFTVHTDGADDPTYMRMFIASMCGPSTPGSNIMSHCEGQQ